MARLSVSGTDRAFDELLLLRRWLLDEPEFRGRVEVEHNPLQPGQMGDVVAALAVALGGGGALAVLAQSVSVWLQQRRSSLSVKIIHPDGSSQEITASGQAADIIATKVDP